MIKWGKVVGLILIVAVASVLMAFTTSTVLQNITLGLDLQGGFEVLYEATPTNDNEISKAALNDTVSAIEKRVNVIGVTEPEISVEGENRIRVKLAGVFDQDAARNLLGTPAKLTFRNVNNEILMDGDDLVQGGAKVDVDQYGQPLIVLKLKDPKKFERITTEYLYQEIGIYLDETELTSPMVKQVISEGTATISGERTVEEAKGIADLLNAGALPLDLKEIQSQSVGASLGLKALDLAVRAGIIGAILILLFMIFYYRVPGIIASLTLTFYVYLILVVFWQMHVTLTLPGIAALVLGVGMAVDANIITYERIKDELRSGKTLLSSVRAGSQRSLSTILDANITTIIAAAVLFYLGESGPISGFAITLIVSILVSMITAVFGARLLLRLLVSSNLVKSKWLYGVKEEEINEL